ncbi:MAG: peptidase M16 [Bacteroidetes bacterium GWA2_31_9b]|nr:MAG: peptidase M16 [Bacteroidetes bacterium GWA2_31_9b]
MRFKKLLLSAFFIAGTCLAYSQANKIEFIEYDMENGLHVILHQDNTTPIVAVTVTYHVGAKNENPERTGFAHFFEHLMFEGTKNINRGEYSEIVEKAGGTLNANTTSDRTYYYEILPSNQLELGLWLESERMFHAKVDSIGIKTQKSVVIEEYKQNYENRPYGSILNETVKRAFEVHPYQWTTIGNPEHIRAAKDDEFLSFYKMFYVPNNAVLCIAGDIDFEKTKSLINTYFATIPKGEFEIYRPSLVEPIKNKEIRDTVYDNIQLPAVLQAYHLPKMGTPDYYAVNMLSTLLSQGQSSRLYKSLVDEKQLALFAASFPLPFEDPSIALNYCFPNVGVDPFVLETAMNEEITKVRNELITDSEFQKIQNQFENQIVNSNTSIQSRAYNLAINYTFYKNTNLINTEIDKYLAVTKEDIKRVANMYFRDDNRVVLYYLPKSQQ